MDQPNNGKKPRIAIVAIHGVSDHLPAEMANAVGDLLADLESDSAGGLPESRYTAFEEKKIRINVAPLKPPLRAFADKPGAKAAIDELHTWGPMDAVYRAGLRGKLPNNAGPEWDVDHLFMEGQIARYQGERPEDTYELQHLRGVRKQNARAPAGQSGAADTVLPKPAEIRETEVHIYDMFWSDLSKLSTAFTQVFGELYQLLFHLGSIGVNNVHAAALDQIRKHPDQRARCWSWRAYSGMEWFTAALLAWPIPVLNLLMLASAVALAATAFVRKLPAGGALFALEASITALIAVVIGLLLLRSREIGKAVFSALGLLVMAGLIAQAYIAFRPNVDLNWAREQMDFVAGIGTLLLGLLAVFALMRAYDLRRPGALAAFWCTAAIWLGLSGAGLWNLIERGPKEYYAMICEVRLVEVGLWLLLATWVVFGISFALTYLIGGLGYFAVRGDDPETRRRKRRTHRTAWVVLAISSIFFLLISTLAWAGISMLVLTTLPASDAKRTPAGNCSVQDLVQYPSWLASKMGPSQTVHCWARDGLVIGGFAYAPILLALLALATVLGLWGFVPIVLNEVSPPRVPKAATDAEKKKAREKLARSSTALGTWLDHGFSILAVSGYLLGFGIVALPVLVALIAPVLPFRNTSISTWISGNGEAAAAALSGFIVLGGAGLLVARGKLQNLAGGFRPVVRVALDVDNWMREHPRDSNPTARICGRYASLLRYILQGGAEKRKYSALIIFAHSQGTVITTDLLRFIEVERLAAERKGKEYDPALKGLTEIPIYLFTMGCPLRQLYGLRFPFLYGYARNDSNRGSNPATPATVPPYPARIRPDESPDPNELGITQWMNAYRSGDYVGRYLWGTSGTAREAWQPVGGQQSNWDPPQGAPDQVWFDNQDKRKIKRIEFSIGPGAHTHYWDATARDIAEALDALIERAI